MAVAKSYQSLAIVKEPFAQSGRMYVVVKMKNGTEKQVRWYSDKEYARMYPDERPVAKEEFKSQHDLLGFQKGYITIFKGDTYPHLEWFKQSIARYTKLWGWYIVSTEEVPEDVPANLTCVKLLWEQVGQENGSLKSESAVKEVVESLIYEPGVSEYVGEIGDRLDMVITVVKSIALENDYGYSTMHIMRDENENEFVWTTASKTWAEGSVKHIRGTVKKYNIYHNIKQTVLNRCMEVK